MRYVIAYDICKPKRLRKIARICEDYGGRMQKSVFECDLDAVMFRRMWNELNKIMKADEDMLIAYPVCKACEERIETAGNMNREEDDPAVLVF